jgi:hypothetical protein
MQYLCHLDCELLVQETTHSPGMLTLSLQVLARLYQLILVYTLPCQNGCQVQGFIYGGRGAQEAPP